VLSMKDLAYDPFLRANGSIVEVAPGARGPKQAVRGPL
jgi:hypothetical protein